MAYDLVNKQNRKKTHTTDTEDKSSKIGGILGAVIAERAGEYAYLDVLDRSAALDEVKDAEVLYSGKRYKIIKKKDEKLPTYITSLPRLSKEEKEILGAAEKRAIAEINIDPESIMNARIRKKTFMKEVMKIMEIHCPKLSLERRAIFAELIVQDMIGYSLLEPLLADDALEEVMVLGTKKRVYVFHRKYGMCKTNIIFENDAEIVNIIAKIARAVGRRVDMSSPLLDARLPDGSRVNATLRPVSLDGPSITIRKFKAVPLTLVDLINFGTFGKEVASFLWLAVEGMGVKPANFLVSGGTGSGKTTTLNCMASFIPSTDRVITIEDTAELQLPVVHWVRLETRPPNIEGQGEVSMDVLLKNVLRMRPDRIIVGEVRGSEANTLLASMNTGQNGCLGTIHANTAKETVTRLTSAPMSVPAVMLPSLDLILMQNKFTYKGKMVRRVTEIGEVTGIHGNRVNMEIIYKWDPKSDTVKPTGAPIRLKKTLAELKGITEKQVDEELKRRESVIEYLTTKKITELREFSSVINKYYTSSKKLLEETKKGREIKEKEQREEIIEETPLYKIVKVENEKTPRYLVPIPNLSSSDKELLEELENTAINEIDVDPAIIPNTEETRKLFLEKVDEIVVKRLGAQSHRKEDFSKLIVYNMLGYGLLEFLINDDALEEIMVVSTGKPVYVYHRMHEICSTNIVFDTDDKILRIIERIAGEVGRRIDRATPLLDARLADGSRVNATVPPVSIGGPTLTIRKFRKDPFTMPDLIRFRTLSVESGAYLWLIVEGMGIKPGNILAAGGSSSGKTTTLNCLGSFIPPKDRIITIEDTAELQFPVEHCIRLETKPPNVEGRGEISMDHLVKNTLRMRPDRIIVGEIRGSEARILFTAMNTGHDGCMGTVHSNSAKETITRLTNPPMNVPAVMLPALDLILIQKKVYSKGKTLRRITEIAEVTTNGSEISLSTVYKWSPKTDSVVVTGNKSVLKQKIAELTGKTAEEIEGEIERRRKVLQWMIDKGINKMADVAGVVDEYYSNRDILMKKVSG